jgi:murein DD-endopeptidase MepM/ murein hydrolase activator NlpD
MARDDRFYAFIVATTSRSRSRIRRISLHKRWLQCSIIVSIAVFAATLYGLYGLSQQVRHMRIEAENQRLRAENEQQRTQLKELNHRVEAVEDTSRRLVEMSGVDLQEQSTETNVKGSGGPALPIKDAAAIVSRADKLEQQLRTVESVLHARSMTPSIWPVGGEMTDSFGGRHNPFGGASSEFHAGQDIATSWGTPVAATANGTVSFAGWQTGYGQLVVLDHGDGLTTRYGHLSEINVSVGQEITKGQSIGNVGSTGRSTGPHLHYEVRLNDEPVDPRRYLPGASE